MSGYGINIVSNLIESKASALSAGTKEEMDRKIESFHRDFEITHQINQNVFEFLVAISPASETHRESLKRMANAAIIDRAADFQSMRQRMYGNK